MTERTFRVERNGVLQFEMNLNPGDGIFLSSAADLYIATIGAEAPENVEEVQGEMNVEYELGEMPTEPEPVIMPDPEPAPEEEVEEEVVVEEPVEVTEEELEEDASYEDWTVEELKDALRSRGLMVSGVKDELIARLEKDDAAPDEEEVEEPADPMDGMDM